MRTLLVQICILSQAPASLAVLRAEPGLRWRDGQQHRARADSGRIAWFHPPKTATSFGSTVVHYADPSTGEREPGSDLERWDRFLRKYGQWLNGTLWLPASDHEPVTPDIYQKFKGTFVGLFRRPEQRIISSFLHKGRGAGSLRVYAERAAGTVVKELAGQEHGEYFACWPGYRDVDAEDIPGDCSGGRAAAPGTIPAVPNLGMAVKRLQDGFMFVGLVEHYHLSVCLFHAMFGGDCLPVEFEELRPMEHSWKRNSSGYDVSRLGGYKDPYDGVLYQHAAGMFWRLIEKHGVDAELCQRLCPHVGSDAWV